jgi:hypothetical protein
MMLTAGTLGAVDRELARTVVLVEAVKGCYGKITNVARLRLN